MTTADDPPISNEPRAEAAMALLMRIAKALIEKNLLSATEIKGLADDEATLWLQRQEGKLPDVQRYFGEISAAIREFEEKVPGPQRA